MSIAQTLQLHATGNGTYQSASYPLLICTLMMLYISINPNITYWRFLIQEAGLDLQKAITFLLNVLPHSDPSEKAPKSLKKRLICVEVHSEPAVSPDLREILCPAWWPVFFQLLFKRSAWLFEYSRRSCSIKPRSSICDNTHWRHTSLHTRFTFSYLWFWFMWTYNRKIRTGSFMFF